MIMVEAGVVGTSDSVKPHNLCSRGKFCVSLCQFYVVCSRSVLVELLPCRDSWLKEQV